jgi:hypothetical protein
MTRSTNFYEELGTPIIPEDMPPEEDASSFTIPTQAELDAQQDDQDDTATTGTDADQLSGDGSDGGADGKGDSVGEGEASTSQRTPEPAPLPQFQLEDPGDYQPKDYSFQVTTYEGEAKVPKQVTISSPEQLDDLLERDADFGSPSQIAKAIRQAAKMESAQDRDKQDWEQAKQEYQQEKQQYDQELTRLNQIAAEMSYLVAKGKLPVIAKQYQDANWSDPTVAKQPGVKEQIELLDYMAKENQARAKAGLAPMAPSQALAELQAEQATQKLVDANKQAGQQRRNAGAKIAGTTPAPAQAARKGVMIGTPIPGGLGGMTDL